MNPDLAQRVDALFSSSAGLVLEQYLLSRITDLRADFEKLPLEKFLEHKGRILELNTLLSTVQKHRNKTHEHPRNHATGFDAA